MEKGDRTRGTILDAAVAQAARVGLQGLTIGTLADALEMSKSGLIAHFGNKEQLQVAVLQHASRGFVEAVVKPALATPRGEPRLRELFDRWLRWGAEAKGRAGCLFVQAAVELDDRPGPARDFLVDTQRDWLDHLAQCVRIAMEEKHLKADVDPVQTAHELYGIMLATHHAARLLKDKEAAPRARRSFDALLARLRRTR